jgi:hypothetical protein
MRGVYNNEPDDAGRSFRPQAAMQTTRRIRGVVHAWLPPEALPPAVQ